MHKSNTFSSTSARFIIPTLAAKICHHAAKVGIKSCRGARECASFVHAAEYL